MTETRDKVERAARRVVQLQSEIADREDQVRDLKLFIAANTNGGTFGDDEAGFLKVSVYQSKKYNEAYGKARYPELWEQFATTKRVLDSATAKKVLSDDQYAAFQKPSAEQTVVIEPLD